MHFYILIILLITIINIITGIDMWKWIRHPNFPTSVFKMHIHVLSFSRFRVYMIIQNEKVSKILYLIEQLVFNINISTPSLKTCTCIIRLSNTFGCDQIYHKALCRAKLIGFDHLLTIFDHSIHITQEWFFIP